MGVELSANHRVDSLADLAVEIVSAFLANLNDSEVGFLIDASRLQPFAILPQIKCILLQIVKPRSFGELSGGNTHDPRIVPRKLISVLLVPTESSKRPGDTFPRVVQRSTP